MSSQHKPQILQDGLMTISSNSEGILYQPSELIKEIFGAKMFPDVYRKRQQPKPAAAAAAAAAAKAKKA